MTNLDALERLARDEGSTNLALRNALLEALSLLRFRTEQLAKALSEEPRPPAPDPALVSWQGLRGTKHPKDRPEEPRT